MRLLLNRSFKFCDFRIPMDEAVPKKLFCVTRYADKDLPDDVSHVTFPSLEILSKNVLLKRLGQAFESKSCSFFPQQIWTVKVWKQLKSYLHQLPLHMLNQFYDEIISFDETAIDECPKCCNKIPQEWLVLFNESYLLFIAWWMFFDEESTTELRENCRAPRDKMTEYLESVPTGLTFIDPKFQVWSEAFFRNQSKLRQMNIQQLYPDQILNEDKFSGLLKLQSLKVGIDIQLNRDNFKIFHRILRTQSQSLKELVMENAQLYDFSDLHEQKFTSGRFWKVLSELPLLSRISMNHWHWHWMMKHQVYIFEQSFLLKSFFSLLIIMFS